MRDRVAQTVQERRYLVNAPLQQTACVERDILTLETNYILARFYRLNATKSLMGSGALSYAIE